jgi:hypothetical protein
MTPVEYITQNPTHTIAQDRDGGTYAYWLGCDSAGDWEECNNQVRGVDWEGWPEEASERIYGRGYPYRRQIQGRVEVTPLRGRSATMITIDDPQSGIIASELMNEEEIREEEEAETSSIDEQLLEATRRTVTGRVSALRDAVTGSASEIRRAFRASAFQSDQIDALSRVMRSSGRSARELAEAGTEHRFPEGTYGHRINEKFPPPYNEILMAETGQRCFEMIPEPSGGTVASLFIYSNSKGYELLGSEAVDFYHTLEVWERVYGGDLPEIPEGLYEYVVGRATQGDPKPETTPEEPPTKPKRRVQL